LREDDTPASAGPLSRLKKRAEFQRVSRGARKSARAFALQAAERAAEDPATGVRVGFTVTKKTGNSPMRNRIRRRLREALRAATPLEARAGHDYVVMARREALSEPFPALVGALRDAFRALTRGEKHSLRDLRRPAAPGEARSQERKRPERKSENRRK
jgi:ribonuclease P protein component